MGVSSRSTLPPGNSHFRAWGWSARRRQIVDCAFALQDTGNNHGDGVGNGVPGNKTTVYTCAFAVSPELSDHFRNPRNVGVLPPPAITVEVSNPVCGDILRLSRA